jgi:ABC-2 type transport system permease protein
VNSPAPISRPSLRLAFSALLRADFAVLLKNRRALLLSILLPIIILALGSSSRAAQRVGGPLFVIGLAIALGLISTSILGYALTIASDREQGVFQRLRVTPAPTWAIMTSRLTTQALANVLIALTVVIVGSVIHHLSISPGQYGVVLLVSVLAGAVFLSIGQALVGLMKSADSVNAAARAVVVGLILLAAFGQRGTLGTTGESITRWSPVGAVMTLFAAVLNTSAWDTRDSLTLLACGGYILVFAAIGIQWFRWDAR